MHAKVTGAQLLMIVSIVFVGVGLFTPLPFSIFSTIGIIGVIIGWLMDIKVDRDEAGKENIDFDINVTDIHAVTFDERLRKLEQLRTDQLITEEEYQLKRKQIMEENW